MRIRDFIRAFLEHHKNEHHLDAARICLWTIRKFYRGKDHQLAQLIYHTMKQYQEKQKPTEWVPVWDIN